MEQRIYFVTCAVRPVSYEGRGSVWDYVSGWTRVHPTEWYRETDRVSELSGIARRLIFWQEVDLDNVPSDVANRLLDDSVDEAGERAPLWVKFG